MEFNRCIKCMEEHTGTGPCPHCGFDAGQYQPEFNQLLPGTILGGKYVVGKVLGQGGFGISYIGWDLNLECKVALKEYYPSSYVTRQTSYSPTVTVLTGSGRELYQKGLEQFVMEARRLAKFGRMPGIVYVRDFFQENETAYIVMEFAEGETLKQLLEKAGGRLPVETVVMLSHKKPDSVINVKVEFGEGEGKVPLDNIAKRAAAYKPKERVTYKMIQSYIEAKYGFKVHTAYIAEVKRDLGLPMYDAPNAVEELKQPRKHPTPEKVEAIKDALKHFEVI